MFLNNGPISSLVSGGKGGLVDWLTTAADTPIEKRIERIYLSVLSRRPTSEETARFIDFVTVEKGEQPRWPDAVWSLLTSSEFRFNQ